MPAAGRHPSTGPTQLWQQHGAASSSALRFSQTTRFSAEPALAATQVRTSQSAPAAAHSSAKLSCQRSAGRVQSGTCRLQRTAAGQQPRLKRSPAGQCCGAGIQQAAQSLAARRQRVQSEGSAGHKAACTSSKRRPVVQVTPSKATFTASLWWLFSNEASKQPTRPAPQPRRQEWAQPWSRQRWCPAGRCWECSVHAGAPCWVASCTCTPIDSGQCPENNQHQGSPPARDTHGSRCRGIPPRCLQSASLPRSAGPAPQLRPLPAAGGAQPHLRVRPEGRLPGPARQHWPAHQQTQPSAPPQNQLPAARLNVTGKRRGQFKPSKQGEQGKCLAGRHR